MVRLADMLADYHLDTYGFVMSAYPWGEPGELQDYAGPRDWHVDALRDVGNRLARGYEPGQAMMPVLKAIASGHGIGKTALLSWLIWWGLSTMVNTRCLITANTEVQLRTRTWPEVCKWAA